MTGSRYAARAGRIPLAVLRYELGMWRSLYRWIARRPAGLGPQAEAFGYTGPINAVLWAFIGLSALEIPIIDLILPWPGARVAVAALGAWGLLWMLGLMASLRVHPHIVDPAGLRIRNGISLDLAVGWDTVAEIRRRYRSLPPDKAARVEETATGLIQSIPVANQTSVDVVLRAPMVVAVPKGTTAPVTELRFYADDPDALVAAARRWLAALPAAADGPPPTVRRTG